MGKHVRKLGWLLAAGLLGAALIAPGATSAVPAIDLGASGTDQSGLCTGDYFKVEDAEDMLVEGTHSYVGTTKEGAAFAANLTVTLDEDGEVDTIVVNSTSPVTVLFVWKAGTQYYSGTSTTIDATKAISNIAFCFAETTTTTTTTEVETTEETTTEVETTEETTTEVETTEETTTEVETTDVTTTDVMTTDVQTTTTKSTGTEEEKTPPSTDTMAQASTGTVSSGLLLVFAGLLALALFVPARVRGRR